MAILIIGGTGFIGRRLIPLLAKRGEAIACMDIAPQTADFSALGKRMRGGQRRSAFSTGIARVI